MDFNLLNDLEAKLKEMRGLGQTNKKIDIFRLREDIKLWERCIDYYQNGLMSYNACLITYDRIMVKYEDRRKKNQEGLK